MNLLLLKLIKFLAVGFSGMLIDFGATWLLKEKLNKINISQIQLALSWLPVPIIYGTGCGLLRATTATSPANIFLLSSLLLSV